MRSERHITANNSPLPLAKILELDSCIIVPGNFGNAKFGNIFFLTTPGTHMKMLYREWGWSSVAWYLFLQGTYMYMQDNAKCKVHSGRWVGQVYLIKVSLQTSASNAS